MRIIVTILLMVGIGACEDAPSKSACKKLVSHLVDIHAKTKSDDVDLEKQKSNILRISGDEMIANCQEKMTAEAVSCYLKASDLEAMTKCEPQSKKN